MNNTNKRMNTVYSEIDTDGTRNNNRTTQTKESLQIRHKQIERREGIIIPQHKPNNNYNYSYKD